MVENLPRRRGSASPEEWAVIHDRYLAGEDTAALAEAYGLSPKTVKDRCRWIVQAFPPGAPLRLRRDLMHRVLEAQTTLESGKPLDAERQAKAITALVRAAQALESWTMDNPKSQPAKLTAQDTADDDPRAELERRLLHLAAFERKRREGEKDCGGETEAMERSGDQDASADVGELGESRTDPAEG